MWILKIPERVIFNRVILGEKISWLKINSLGGGRGPSPCNVAGGLRRCWGPSCRASRSRAGRTAAAALSSADSLRVCLGWTCP